jgi:hypothetical protein
MDEQTWATLNRDELIGLVRARDATILELQRRIAALEQRLAGRGGGGMPGNKPARPPSAKPQTARKKWDHGFGRPRLPPTETVQHALDTCPTCLTRLVGGWVQATREVIEVPLVAVRVIEHQYIARVCPLCRQRQVPSVDLSGIVGDKQQRLGIGLVSLITTLREVGRLPFATIQWYLATVHHLRLSVGALVRVVTQVARRARAAQERIQQAIQTSPVVWADETGWREKGHNGFVWTLGTPTEHYFVRGGRNKEMVDAALGPTFAGVLVCDFYASYDHYPGLKQRCWAHLLRAIHDLREIYPTDVSLANWAAAVHTFDEEAQAFSDPDEGKRIAHQQAFEKRLLALCQTFLADPLAVQGKLCRRIAKYLTELFVFVANPLVPSTNNGAERRLRHLVTSRKISGGTQSPAGTRTKMLLASLFATWRLHGLNPVLARQQFLQSPAH